MILFSWLSPLTNDRIRMMTSNDSINVNEVIRAVLDFFIFIFFTKRFHTHNKHKTHISEQKEKGHCLMHLENI